MATANHELRGGASPSNVIMLSGGGGIWKLVWSEQHQERVFATRQKSRIKKGLFFKWVSILLKKLSPLTSILSHKGRGGKVNDWRFQSHKGRGSKVGQ